METAPRERNLKELADQQFALNQHASRFTNVRRTSLLLSLLVVAVGTSVLVGWIFDIAARVASDDTE